PGIPAVRRPAEAARLPPSARPVEFVPAGRPGGPAGLTEAEGRVVRLPAVVLRAPAAPFVTETWADHGPSSKPPSTPSSDELKLVPVTWRMKALSSSMRSPNGTNIRPAFT